MTNIRPPQKHEKRKRNLRIVELQKQGYSIRQIASLEKITDTRVLTILKAIKKLV